MKILGLKPMKNNIFYLHIPKTAGSSLNRFICSQFQKNSCLTHIESKIDFSKEVDIKKAEQYKVLSGHIPLPHMQNKLKVLDNRIVITTLRNPIEHVISHIAWVRKLGDKGEEGRLKQHNQTVQKIVKKLLSLDLSKPMNISTLIQWLEDENIFLFHDTQIKYIGGGGGVVKPHIVKNALINLKKINFVGITERLSEFQFLLCDALNWKIKEDINIKENKNDCYYGLNIQDSEIRKSLQPLIQWDQLIYRVARERFIYDMHNFLFELEKSKGPRFSTVREQMLINEYKVTEK